MVKFARILLLVAPLLAGGAGAEEDPHQVLKKAAVFFDLGKFAEAAGQYEQLYTLRPVPELLYNIGQSYRLAGDIEKALFFYRRYLSKLPTAKNADEVKRRINELEAVRSAQHSPPNDTTPVASEPATTSPPPPATTKTTATATPPPPATTTKAPVEPSPPPPTSTPSTTSTPTSNPAITEPAPTATPTDRPARGGSKVGVVVGVVVAGVVVLAGVGIGLGVGLAPGPSFNPTLGEIGPGPHMAPLVGF